MALAQTNHSSVKHLIDLLHQFNFLKMWILIKVSPTFSKNDGFGVRCQLHVVGDG